jgi:biopolymer transport protein ExbB
MADAVVAPENHSNFGIQDLWDSGPVSKVLLSILVVMSLYSWYVLIVKLLDQNALNKYAASVDKDFWSAPSIADGIARMKGEDENVFRAIASDAVQSVSHHEKNKGKLTETIDLHDWVSGHMQRRVDQINSDLNSGMAVLASVGATAPFVGLLGTVLGILNAMRSIAMSGNASIEKVAGPVGEALWMTAVGLAVAIPAVLGFNWLTRRNKAISDAVNHFAHDLHQAVLSGGRVAISKPSAPAAAVKK